MSPARTEESGYSVNDPYQVDDKKFAELLKQRNPDALAVLSLQHSPRVGVLLERKFGVFISPEDRKDIIAEAVLRAFNNGDRFNPELGSAVTWLNAIATKVAFEHLRKHGMTDNTLDQLTNCIAAQIESEVDVPEVQAQPSEKMEKLLRQLPPARQKVIYMHYYQGLSISAIAELLGVERGTVKGNLSRGRQDLRALLEGSDEGSQE